MNAQRHELAAVLLPVLIAEYGGTEQDWTAMRSLLRIADAVLAHVDRRAAA